MAPTGEEGGDWGEGRREGPGAGREEGGQSSCERRRGRTGRGDVTHPPAVIVDIIANGQYWCESR